MLRPAQSRSASLVEALANVLLGFVVALLTQQFVFPLVGIATTLAQDSLVAAVFTAVSLARSFLLRRLFEQVGTGGDLDHTDTPERSSCPPTALPWVLGQGWLDAPAVSFSHDAAPTSQSSGDAPGAR